ncbi:gamma-glutamylcyclotransferase family protein [Hasllibacter sp. MH4015]|uniref:gamma-glutamylcyclotransferase family protein n=1 Tax=Hasllibacter sp. MH4015 TaxID=2854029 RepID=UPI001CD4FFF9|nr:gamma-glutamylcyclotransferase family protein [Hasllibacter sp. MH4015]
MNAPFFFGYGSLVNRETHAYPDVTHAHVAGWSRRWQGTGLRKLAFLTAQPDSGGEIRGLIAAVPNADWAALDERERAYARHGVASIAHDHPAATDIQIYAVEKLHAEEGTHPILLSYLDTVIQGYLTEFGEAGAVEFFETTQGWNRPVMNDRNAPLYPRATGVSAAERSFVDENLQRVQAALAG